MTIKVAILYYLTVTFDIILWWKHNSLCDVQSARALGYQMSCMIKVLIKMVVCLLFWQWPSLSKVCSASSLVYSKMTYDIKMTFDMKINHYQMAECGSEIKSEDSVTE